MRIIYILLFLAASFLSAGATVEPRLPLLFEANTGSDDGRYPFVGRMNGKVMGLAADELSILAAGRPVRVRFLGADALAAVGELQPVAAKTSYFTGNDPARWRADVPMFHRVSWQNVYEGVDVVVYATGQSVEYDFVVAAGADYRVVELAFDGADQVRLTPEGDIRLSMAGVVVWQHRPVVYQETRQGRCNVEGRYVPRGPGRFGVELGCYDETLPVVIDPTLTTSTFLGGLDQDRTYAVATDQAGHLYVLGRTSSSNFPITEGGLQQFISSADVFVSKFNSNGTELVYSAILGGSKGDTGYGLEVDADGAVYVAGETRSEDYPVTAGAYQTFWAGGGSEAFVTKIAPAGNALVFSTLLGGTKGDTANAIAIDSAGSLYVCGDTTSKDFPLSDGALQAKFGGVSDGFVTRLDPTGSVMLYSTYLGGKKGTKTRVEKSCDSTGGLISIDYNCSKRTFSTSESALSVAVDDSGCAYVAGLTSSGNFPVTENSFQPKKGRKTDAFVSKINPEGTAFIYSTYLGGRKNDGALALVVDRDGHAIVGGEAGSSDFPVTPDSVQPAKSAETDVFVAKLTPKGCGLVFSTFIGGKESETGKGLALDRLGNIYVTGYTGSTDFPLVDSFHENLPATEAFLTKLNPTGRAMIYSTYLGGNGSDSSVAVAMRDDSTAVIVGRTSSRNFPVTDGAFQSVYAGGDRDAFLAMVTEPPVLASHLSVNIHEPSAGLYQNSSAVISLTVTNLGPVAAADARLTYALPAGAEFVTATLSQGSSIVTSNGLVCDLGHMEVGQNALIEVTIIPRQAGFVTTTASVDSDGGVAGSAAQCLEVQSRDFAVLKIRAPRRVVLSSLSPTVTRRVSVLIQNKGLYPQIVADPVALEALVSLEVEALGFGCGTLSMSLSSNTVARLPREIKAGAGFVVSYDVTFDCATDATGDDYRYIATVDQFHFDGEPDAWPGNDECPRPATEIDRGCKEVLTDVVKTGD